MPPSTDEDDQDRAWLAKVADGGVHGEKAAQALFGKYYRRLVDDMMRKFGFEQALAEDLVQEGFVRAFKGARTFRRQARVFTWLYRIVANRCLDHLRSPRPEDTVDEAWWNAAEASPALASDGDDACRDVDAMQRCVDRQFALFSERHPRHAEVVTQIYFNKRTTREAAAARGCSVEAMRQFLVDCRRKMREYFEICRQFLEP